MAERFEDLIAWQRARELTRDIYRITRTGDFARDFDLMRQIRRASVSVMSNIAEGVERSGANELPHFLSLAKGSCAEIRSQLYVALDVGYLSHDEFVVILGRVQELGRILSGLRNSRLKPRGTDRGPCRLSTLDSRLVTTEALP